MHGFNMSVKDFSLYACVSTFLLTISPVIYRSCVWCVGPATLLIITIHKVRKAKTLKKFCAEIV